MHIWSPQCLRTPYIYGEPITRAYNAHISSSGGQLELGTVMAFPAFATTDACTTVACVSEILSPLVQHSARKRGGPQAGQVTKAHTMCNVALVTSIVSKYA